jgi:GNAT superfamily N-acetyltransferase
MAHTIRNYQPGDEDNQAAIWNAAAAGLPGGKLTTALEVRRRTSAKDFDPALRFYAESNGQVVGYCALNANGRVGYPWCLRGHDVAAALLDAAIETARNRGMTRIFSTYRADWTTPNSFFEKNGFAKLREMVNFVQSVVDLPTMVVRRGLNVSPLRPSEIPLAVALAPGVVRLPVEKLEQEWFYNPYYPPESLFALRRADNSIQGLAIFINNSAYANPLQIDVQAPCFRLGAFGTEGMSTKRVNGLFSVLIGEGGDGLTVGLDLLSYLIGKLQNETIDTLAAQAPSDAAQLLGFYQRFFRKQGAFPIYERVL